MNAIDALCVLLNEFAARTPVVRGQRIEHMEFHIDVTSGQPCLEAAIAPPESGDTLATIIHQADLAESGLDSVWFFGSTAEIMAVLRGEREAEWLYDDEIGTTLD